MDGRMMARRLSLVVAVLTMTASGWYVAIYLARWEWNRALIAGVIFIAAEVALLGVLLIDRMARLDRRIDQLAASGSRSKRIDDPGDPAESGHLRAPRSGHADPRIVARVREAAPPPRKPFAWLSDSSNRMSVFVPVLLGAGVVLSGAAWAVERLARRIRGRALERRLAAKLDTLSLPPGGLLGEPQHDPFSPAP
jgi:hypothetical protein